MSKTANPLADDRIKRRIDLCPSETVNFVKVENLTNCLSEIVWFKVLPIYFTDEKH